MNELTPPPIEKEPTSPTSEILLATPENVTDQELRALAGNLCLQIFEPAGQHAKKELETIIHSLVLAGQREEEIREGVREDIDDLLGLLQGVNIQKSTKIKEPSGSSLKVWFDSCFDSMKDLRQQGQLWIARVDNKAVATVGYRQNKVPAPDGRKLYEIKSVSTLKEYERRGCFRQLAEQVCAQIKAKDSEGIITAVTKTKGVKNYFLTVPGWASSGPILSEHPMAKAMLPNINPKLHKTMNAEGYEVLYYDPQTANAKAPL